MNSAAVGRANHERRAEFAGRTVTHLRDLAVELIESRKEKIDELNLGDRTEPVHRHAERRAENPCFRQRRVENATLAEPFKSPSVARKTPPRQRYPDQEHDARIVRHFLLAAPNEPLAPSSSGRSKPDRQSSCARLRQEALGKEVRSRLALVHVGSAYVMIEDADGIGRRQRFGFGKSRFYFRRDLRRQPRLRRRREQVATARMTRIRTRGSFRRHGPIRPEGVR